MRVFLFFLFAIMCIGCSTSHSTSRSTSQSNFPSTLTLRPLPHHTSHYVVFGFSDKVITGHTFVGLGADSAGVSTYQAFGLYPQSFRRAALQTGGTLFTLRRVPGQLKDDSKLITDAKYRVVIYVDKGTFEKAQSVIKSFSIQSQYSLFDWDCVTMMQKVAESVGLKTLPRRKIITPRLAVQMLIQENSQLAPTNELDAMGVY